MFDFFKSGRKREERQSEVQRGVSRAQFLRGDIRGKNRPLRPPWALPEYQFTEECTRCGECVKYCETNILVEARAKFPVVEFKRGECTFCGECVNHCKPQALRFLPTEDDEQGVAWSMEVRLAHTCIAQRGVVCQVCGDQCLEEVFKFRPRVGGAVQMEMSTDKCNGCGACIAPCPVDALSLHHREIVKEDN
ncbi:MAG: ferredoxin-type protein NapF [Thiotrichales bacterium]|jgi:ferredoxin-type protein NapF|nr:ferredoxin-type protein NapF [Thiotrichales bacterium]MBT3613937.1 ferredoxin-type protein NapF [Thiotrichales bacterium]MBT3752199.1 ferredoxin-type protein NapF [Thiotrichales bacterium]MBT3836877.1 ferredoxin-type protein NapF [Thiotrichales bacterium]MBT4151769.1 ferredoxin-type protein NapF [Thiotrichales bacterium]